MDFVVFLLLSLIMAGIVFICYNLFNIYVLIQERNSINAMNRKLLAELLEDRRRLINENHEIYDFDFENDEMDEVYEIDPGEVMAEEQAADPIFRLLEPDVSGSDAQQADNNKQPGNKNDKWPKAA